MIKEILILARSLIDTEDKWCQRYEDGEGRICAVHALQRAWQMLCKRQDTFAETLAYRALSVAIFDEWTSGPAIGQWNDTHTHEQVLAAFDKAIEVTP